MDFGNHSIFKNFVLLGLSANSRTQIILFNFFFIVYMTTLAGNVLLMVSVRIDRRLHTSMYFFLTNLSFLDILNSSVILPSVLKNTVTSKKSISYAECFLQVYFFLLLAQTECSLLAFMAYDRYVAICNPLHYNVVMNTVSCIRMISVSWVTGCITSSIDIYFMSLLRFCGPTTIDHFFCEAPSLLQLSCSDISVNNIVTLVGSSILLIIPLSLILFSYVQIFFVLKKIQAGRYKTFSTCVSHLIVVIIYYGTALFMYMQPRHKTTEGSDKVVSVFYTIVTPMLNPLIYSLRNKDVHRALRRLGRCKDMM
ncbi:olfactory receptor 2D3-like [Rhinoderma darwinii]|uniref:olfactory receptor 2D3-like n=1 Tax=Rhinoderma darwinii TaxID=43563 RepID=UPI003F67275C